MHLREAGLSVTNSFLDFDLSICYNADVKIYIYRIYYFKK